MSTYAVHQPTRSADEADRVSEWRYEQFLRLGFNKGQAWELAGSNADLQSSRTLIAVGCSHHLAMRILL
jgi:hypothetical protein